MYLRNSFYMAGWSTDFDSETVSQVWLLNEPIAVYRDSSGTVRALEDRCPHRAAPLSKGRREGDDIRCMYHGIRFGPNGACTDLPGQAVIPPAVCVKTYRVEEKNGAVWIWMGPSELASPDQVPDTIGPQDPDWAVTTGCLEVAAEGQLLIDNLLDVSHAPYVHAATFGANDRHNIEIMIKAENEAKVTKQERGIKVERWMPGRTGHKFLDGITTDDFAFNDVSVPGVFRLWTYSFPEGTQAKTGQVELPTSEPLFARHVGQVVTPVGDGKCKLFYSAGPWRKQDTFGTQFFDLAGKAFKEDEAIIEAQQQVIEALPGRSMMMLNMDGPLKRYEAIVRKLRALEPA